MYSASPGELHDWLQTHHSQEAGVWLVTYQKSIPDKYVSTSEVLDELLCFGWIDGIRRKLDPDRTMQLITPRRAQHWSATYKQRVARLTEEGRMREPGLRSVEEGKQSALWNFPDDVDQLIVPEDLAAELQRHPTAEPFFQNINPSSKRFVLRWIKLAKTDNTRNKRIREIARLSARGEKLKGS